MAGFKHNSELWEWLYLNTVINKDGSIEINTDSNIETEYTQDELDVNLSSEISLDYPLESQDLNYEIYIVPEEVLIIINSLKFASQHKLIEIPSIVFTDLQNSETAIHTFVNQINNILKSVSIVGKDPNYRILAEIPNEEIEVDVLLEKIQLYIDTNCQVIFV